MRLRWLGAAFFLLGVLMLSPHLSPGQPGGGRGGFGKGSFGGKGGRGGFAPDPERSFSFIAQNGDVIDFSKMDPNQKRFASKMFERNGMPVPGDNAVVTKAQFVDAFNRAQAARGGAPAGPPGGPGSFGRGGFGGPPSGGSGGPPGGFQGRTFTFGGPPGGSGGPMMMQPSGGPPMGGPPSGFGRGPGGPGSGGPPGGGMTDERIQEMFARYDRNRDGKIDYDEASDRTKPDFNDADSNKDGGIDATEYKAYVQKKYGGDPNGGNGNSTASSGGGGPGPGNGYDRKDPRRDPNQNQEPPLVAIRYGKLPDGLPSWWNELDTDKDGQVGLYEWREGGRDMKEFLTMDLDADGLLAPQEMLRYSAIKSEKDRLLAAQAADEGFEVPTPGGSNGSRPAFGGPGFGGQGFGGPSFGGPGAGGRNGGGRNGGGRNSGGRNGGGRNGGSADNPDSGNRGPWGGNSQPKGKR